jgi:hypothetical protein
MYMKQKCELLIDSTQILKARSKEEERKKEKLKIRGGKSQAILTEKEQRDFSLPFEIDSNLLLKSFSAGNRLQTSSFLKRSPTFILCAFQGSTKGGWEL